MILQKIMEVATITVYEDLRMLQRYIHLRAEDLAKKLGYIRSRYLLELYFPDNLSSLLC